MFMGLYQDTIFIIHNARRESSNLQNTISPDQWFRNPVGFWYCDDNTEVKCFRYGYPDFTLPLKKSKHIIELNNLIGVFVDPDFNVYGFYDDFSRHSKISDLEYGREFRVTNHTTMLLDLYTPITDTKLPFDEYIQLQLAGISSSTYGLQYLSYYTISVEDFKKCFDHRNAKEFDEINKLWKMNTILPAAPIEMSIEELPTMSYTGLAHLV